MIVNSTALGWSDWIRPKVFNAFQCRGSCSRDKAPHLQGNHAIIRAVIESSQGKKATDSCCIPVSLKPVTVIRHVEDHLILESYDLEVGECGCF